MVLDYYNLKDQPFGITPDPLYLYLSASHREALASLSYGIRSRRGFMSLIAQPGMGKTTLLFQLLSQLQGSARTVFLFQTLCSPKELLSDILRDLGIVDDGGDAGRMQEQLNRVLLAEAREGRRVVVVIDEAQNLDDSALELLRMLSNFETTRYKLMQIILSGQPQLQEKLQLPHMLQLRQRMSIRAQLQAFSIEETHIYINHRLKVAGYDFKKPLFTPPAAALIAKCSEGIPRNINNICFNVLSLGCVLKQKSIREEVVRECLHDLDFEIEAGKDADEESIGRNLVAFKQNKPAERPLLAWRRGTAVCAMLLLQLFCLTGGDRSTKALASHSLLANRANAQTGSRDFAPVVVMSPPGPTIPPSAGETGSSKEPRPVGAADERSATPEPLPSTTIEKLRRHLHADVEQPVNVAKLWEEVRNESSDAEVELARLYLGGTAVPQNCAQAKVLLEAASRRGNAHASDLLGNSAGQCR